jgi:hypothetical protein
MAGAEGEPGRLIVVTGADTKYYALVAELIASIRRFPEGGSLPIAVLDGGLEPEQIKGLKADGAQIVKPDWPSAEIEARCQGREHLRIELAKPHLDQLFPGYDIIVWLDGDTWVQTWDAIDICAEVVRRGKLAVVSQASRMQSHHIAMRKRLFGWVEPRGILFKNATRAKLPKPLAWSLVNRPVLNAGVYALKSDAPHWAKWRKWRDQCLTHGRIFTAGQLALALTAYGPWRVDPARGMVVSHFAPYDPVSIVHLVAQEAMRADADETVAATDCEDQPIDVPLRYGAFAARFGGGEGN